MAIDTTLSRRTFAKASALTAAAAAIGVSMSDLLVETDQAYADSAAETKVVKTSCHGCIQMCPARAYIENGVVVKLEGDPDAPVSRGSLCMKGINQIHTMYSPRRVLHPLKRAGERGENKWEVISWDEAIELAATQITQAIDKYGPYSFFTSVGGGGAYSFIEAMTMPMALGSPTVFEPGCAQCYLPRYATSALMWGGHSQSIADNDVQEIFRPIEDNKTELVVLWGAQPSISQTAESGRGMAELKAAGAKTIVVDPCFTPDAAKADHWLNVRPAADTSLLLSWFRYIFVNKLYDEEFARYWTDLPFLIDVETKLPVEAKDLFPDYQSPTPANTPAYVCVDMNKLAGEEDRVDKELSADKLAAAVAPFPYSLPKDSPVVPKMFATVEFGGRKLKTAAQIYWEEAEPWTLEATEENCWVSAARNEAAILEYANAKVGGIVCGVAAEQTPASSPVIVGCMGLDALMGYVNKPGCTLTTYGEGEKNNPTKRPVTFVNGFDGMFSDMYGVGAVIGMSPEENEARINAFPKEQQELMNQIMIDRLGSVEHKGLTSWCHSHIPTVLEAIKTGEPFKPRVWFDMSGNKLAMLGNATSWYEAFPEVDFIIGQYPMLTSFHIEACDLVFPLREWLEEPQVNMNQLGSIWIQNECTHIGETVSHSIPAAQVLERCREKWGGKLPGLIPGYLGAPSEKAVKEEVAGKFGAKDWDDLQKNLDTYVPKFIPYDDYFKYNQHEVIVDDGLPAGFGTESRKFEAYVIQYIKMSRTGYPFFYPKPQKPASADYHPTCFFLEPHETPLEDKEYPFAITSGRVPYFHHGTMRHAPFARELYPVPEVKINPADAAELGIAHMDWVKIESRRGEIRGRAYLTEGVSRKAVWMERFWNPECFDESVPKEKQTAGWRECNINVLTKNTAPFNEVFGSYTNRGFTVRISKDKKPDNVWVEPKEFQPFMPTLQSEPVTEDVF